MVDGEAVRNGLGQVAVRSDERVRAGFLNAQVAERGNPGRGANAWRAGGDAAAAGPLFIATATVLVSPVTTLPYWSSTSTLKEGMV